MALQILALGGACLILTAALTAFFVRFCKRGMTAILLGALCLPLVSSVWGLYDLLNIEADSPPPGMLLIGGLIMLAVFLPCTFLVSMSTVRFIKGPEYLD